MDPIRTEPFTARWPAQSNTPSTGKRIVYSNWSASSIGALGGYGCHLRDMGARSRSHSRESGNDQVPRSCELIAWTYEQFHAKAQSTQRPQREAERNSFISFASFACFAPLRETLCLSSDCFKRSKPLRRSGGRADLGRHPLGTLTRPCGKADAICRCAVRSRIPRNSGRAKEQGCATRSPQSGLGCGIVSRLAERLGFKIPDSGFGSRDSGVGSQLTTDN